MIETRLLKSFICVAEELHFGRAALRLHIAQPALTRQIKQLEEKLGVVLLERTQRKVILTSAGRHFYTRACQIIADIHYAASEVKRVNAGEAGLLSVGFIHSSTYGITPKVLRLFRDRYPEVELDLSEMTIADQIAGLQAEKLDVGILRPPISDIRLQTHTLCDETFILAVPASHPLAEHGIVALEKLKEERFILFSQHMSPLFYSRIIAMCERAGFVPRVAQQATQIHTVMGLISANMGISIVPSVARNLNMPEVSCLEIENAPPPVQVALAWRRSDESSILRAFRECAASLFPSH
ncbi:LysR family transcriptional regulator [Halomonas dongshanensis]|uniref:LysR family transcriptional regulator n=1 Tax=Halomonas dongshanensis TaxID=2890835 RepID=A0ABT2EDU8_9GAMM|nr:LysR family transcriptional regulator [Halomonas dongshanensis]MCS2609766.1 LysR family transcriptional regulator [Halomonas dongshanensis]